MKKRGCQHYLLPIGTGTNMLIPIGTGTNMLIPIGTGTNMLIPIGTGNTTTKHVRTRALNHRQRKFARALARGLAPMEAQRISGFKLHRGNAWRMARDPRIVDERKRIERKQRRSSRKRGGGESR